MNDCWTDGITRCWYYGGATDDVLDQMTRSGTAEKFLSLSSFSGSLISFNHLSIHLLIWSFRYSVIYLPYIYRSSIYSFHPASSLHQLVVKPFINPSDNDIFLTLKTINHSVMLNEHHLASSLSGFRSIRVSHKINDGLSSKNRDPWTALSHFLRFRKITQDLCMSLNPWFAFVQRNIARGPHVTQVHEVVPGPWHRHAPMKCR